MAGTDLGPNLFLQHVQFSMMVAISLLLLFIGYLIHVDF